MISKILKQIKLRELRISNFKAIDNLLLPFPQPKVPEEPDILVMGSRNGLGKTSVLEACALFFLSLKYGEKFLNIGERSALSVDLPDLLIRSGAKRTEIEALVSVDKEEVRIKISMNRSGKMEIEGEKSDFLKELMHQRNGRSPEMMELFLLSMVGLNAEPLVSLPLIYFHSYRKVQEGNPEFGMMVEAERFHRRARYHPSYSWPISTFKIQILQSMMAQANLFEVVEEKHSGDVLSKLNELVKRYAGGTIEKLRPSEDNTVDFRISPSNGGQSFTFDGLSSGQKEIISTLFLIWNSTRTSQGIVLIDEPELHLNAEWHRDFVRQVTELVPRNQYIVATHSEDIFSSVSKEHRVLLQP